MADFDLSNFQPKHDPGFSILSEDELTEDESLADALDDLMESGREHNSDTGISLDDILRSKAESIKRRRR